MSNGDNNILLCNLTLDALQHMRPIHDEINQVTYLTEHQEYIILGTITMTGTVSDSNHQLQEITAHIDWNTLVPADYKTGGLISVTPDQAIVYIDSCSAIYNNSNGIEIFDTKVVQWKHQVIQDVRQSLQNVF